MKTDSKWKRVFSVLVVVVSAASIGVLTVWAIRGDDAREFRLLEKNALCVLDLPAGVPKVSASFAIARKLNQFEVALRSKGKDEQVTFLVTGRSGLVCSLTTDERKSRFGAGRDISPGTYEVTLRQDTGRSGARVVVAAEKPVFITGWQIWSWVFLGMLVLSGVWAVAARNSANVKRRAASIFIFRRLLFCLAMLFLYLLFHEGGHALAEIAFGRYDFARSDFWGIHGHPHSGGKFGPDLEPWQWAIMSGGGPMLPTFAGWMLFLLWRCRWGQHVRRGWPMVDLFFSGAVAILVFPGVVGMPGYLLGFMSDGDWFGFINNVPGPMWLVKGLLWASIPAGVFVLWRVVPGMWRQLRPPLAGSNIEHALLKSFDQPRF